MSESFDGFSVAATRQNAGSPLNARAFAGESSPPAPLEGLNVPAATSPACVMVTFGSASAVSWSHAVAALSGCRGMTAARTTAARTPARIRIHPPTMVRLKADTTYAGVVSGFGRTKSTSEELSNNPHVAFNRGMQLVDRDEFLSRMGDLD
jgi:hypothetical protein